MNKLTRDRAEAAALLVAERWLIKQGWKFNPADVGTRAKEIIDALDAGRLALSKEGEAS